MKGHVETRLTRGWTARSSGGCLFLPVPSAEFRCGDWACSGVRLVDVLSEELALKLHND